MSNKCIKALVSGRVQGVFFRESTRRQAMQLGLVGHAVNLHDGRVEVVVCGNADAIASLTRWLHQGPDLASVSDVTIEDIDILPPGDFTTG